MFEWSVTVTCPVRRLDGIAHHAQGENLVRTIYLWTSQCSAVDAYEEVLRVLEGWPAGTRVLDVVPVGLYVPTRPGDREDAWQAA